jgi:hypothetical protein
MWPSAFHAEHPSVKTAGFLLTIGTLSTKFTDSSTAWNQPYADFVKYIALPTAVSAIDIPALRRVFAQLIDFYLLNPDFKELMNSHVPTHYATAWSLVVAHLRLLLGHHLICVGRWGHAWYYNKTADTLPVLLPNNIASRIKHFTVLRAARDEALLTFTNSCKSRLSRLHPAGARRDRRTAKDRADPRPRSPLVCSSSGASLQSDFVSQPPATKRPTATPSPPKRLKRSKSKHHPTRTATITSPSSPTREVQRYRVPDILAQSSPIPVRSRTPRPAPPTASRGLPNAASYQNSTSLDLDGFRALLNSVPLPSISLPVLGSTLRAVFFGFSTKVNTSSIIN